MNMAVAQGAKSLRIRVVDHTKDGKPAVNIKMPVSIVRWGMKMAQSFSPEMKDVAVDWDAINQMIAEGELGKLIEVEDEAQSKTVEIWVE